MLYTDPFFVYSYSPKRGYIASYAHFQAMGIAKSSTYKNIIIGTSMAANFDVATASKLSGSTYQKSILLGATAYELADLTSLAITSHHPSNIIMSLDIQTFRGEPDRQDDSYTTNTKIFKGSWLAPLYYIFNIDFLKVAINQYFIKDKVNNYFGYVREDGAEFVLRDWRRRSKKDKDTKLERLQDTFSFEKLKISINNNLIRLIQMNPDTKFTLFFPPYSIVEWIGYAENLHLTDYLKAREYIAKQIVGLSNAKLYDFSSDIKIIENLGNYSDTMHYSVAISDMLLESMLTSKLQSQSVTDIEKHNKLILQSVNKLQGQYSDL